MNEFDISEIQEFQNIDFLGGFGSVFGDGEHVEISICQHCLLKIKNKEIK